MADAGLGYREPDQGAGLGDEQSDAPLTMAERYRMIREGEARGIPPEVTAQQFGVPEPQTTAPDDDLPSRTELLPGALRSTAESAVRGAGELAESALGLDGAREAVDPLADTLAPTEIQEQRRQDRAEARQERYEADMEAAGDSKWGQRVAKAKDVASEAGDALLESSPQIGASFGAGAATNALMRKKGVDFLSRLLPGRLGRIVRDNPKAITRFFTYMGAAAPNALLVHDQGAQRAVEEGMDLDDPKTQRLLNAQTAIRTAFETIAPLGFISKIVGEAPVRRSLIKAASREGAISLSVEGLTEMADSAIENLFFEEGLWDSLKDGDKQAIIQHLRENGREYIVAGLAGAGMGASVGAPLAARQQAQTNAKMKQDTEHLARTMEPLGLDGAQIEEMTRTREGTEKLRDAVSELGQIERARLDQERMIEQVPDRELADAMRADISADLDARIDEVAERLGAPKKMVDLRREREEQLRMRREQAMQRLEKIGQTVKGDVDPAVAEAQANALEQADARVRQLEDRVTAIANPERKAEAQAELDQAQRDLYQARVDAKQKLEGLTPEQATEAVKRDDRKSEAERRRERQAESRERAIQRQMDLEMPESMAPEARAQRAREIIEENDTAGREDKGFERKVRRLRNKRRAATAPEDIDRLTNEIADLEARRGLPTPAVEAARRVLQAQGKEVSPGSETEAQRPGGEPSPAGDVAEGPGLATAGQQTGPGPASEPAGSPSPEIDTLLPDVEPARRTRAVELAETITEGTAPADTVRAEFDEVTGGRVTPEQVVTAARGPELRAALDNATREVGFAYDGVPASDLMAELGSPATMAEAERAMRDWTATTGFEAAAHIGKDGRVLGIVTNNMQDGVLPPADGYADPDVVFTHTHPVDTPISATDLMAMFSAPQTFRAVHPSGVTEVRPLKALTREEFLTINREVSAARDAVMAHDLPRLTRDRVRQEAINQALETAGAIQYTRPFSGLTEQEAAHVDEILTRTEPAIAALRGRLGERADVAETGSLWGPPGARRAFDEAGNEIDEDTAEGDIAQLLDDGFDTRSSQREKRPSFDPAKVDELTDGVVDLIEQRRKPGRKPDLVQGYLDGTITRDHIRRGIEAWLRNDGMKVMFSVIDVRRRMFQNQITPDMLHRYPENRSGRAVKKGTMLWGVKPEHQKDFRAALGLRELVGELGHGKFTRTKNPFTAKRSFDNENYIHGVSPELAAFVDLQPPEGMRFDPPLANPNDVTKLRRDRVNNRLSEEGLEVAARTARYLQANRYKIDRDRLYAMTPDQLVTKKSMARDGMPNKQEYLDRWDAMKEEIGDKPFAEWTDEQVTFWRDYGKKIDEKRREAEKRIGQMRSAYERFVAKHGEDADVGFLYQIDNRGRIYADGSFHPQADEDIKALFSHDGMNLVDDMVSLDASASGWQINALMARDHVAAPHLNMGRDQAAQEGYTKSDLYTITLQGMRRRLLADAARDPKEGATPDERADIRWRAKTAQAFIDNVFPSEHPGSWSINRNGLKPAIIAMNYGGQRPTFIRTLVDTLGTRMQGKLPGGGEGAWGYLGDIGMEAVAENAPHSIALQAWSIDSIEKLIKAMQAKYGKEGVPPLEFTIGIDGKVRVRKTDRRDTQTRLFPPKSELLPGGELQVNFKVDLNTVNPKRTARAIWANMVQSYDAAVLHRAIERYKRATDGAYVTTNHDSFTVPPEREADMAAAVRESMRVIMEQVDVPRILYDEIQARAREHGVEIDVEPFGNMGQYSMDDLMSSTPVFGEGGGRPDDFVPEYGELPEEGADLRRAQDEEPPAVPGEPAPLYANRPVLNEAEIRAWAERNGVPVTVPEGEMHVTVSYSREPVDVADAPAKTDAPSGDVRGRVTTMGDALVLELPPTTLGLDADHRRYRDAGASYDFPSYRPHVTLSYDAGDVDVANFPAYEGPLQLGPEDQRAMRLEDEASAERGGAPSPPEPSPAAGPSAGERGTLTPELRAARDDAVEVASYMRQLPQSQNLVNKIRTHMTDARVGQRGFWDIIEDNFTNAFAPIRRLEIGLRGELPQGAESAYKSAEMAVNDSGRQEMLLYYGAAKLGEHGEYAIAPGTLGLKDIFKIAGGDGDGRGQRIVDWMQWMIARRAEQLHAEGINTPLSQSDIIAAKEKEIPEFVRAAEEWKKHNDANIDFLVDTGRIGRAQADAMKADEFYVPFYRSDERVDGTSPELVLDGYKPGTISTGILKRDPGIMAIKGGDKMRIENLMQNMIRNSQAMVAAGMRNRAANMSFDLMIEAGLAEDAPISSKKPDPNAVRMWRGGEERWVIPRGRDAYPMMMALAGLQPTQLTMIGQLGADIASIFRQGITLTPPFMIRNAIRGAVSSGIMTTGANLTVTNNTVTGMRDALKKNAATQAFKAQSGMGDYRFGNSDIGFGKDDILVEFGAARGNIWTKFRAAMNKAEEVGTATELADRVAAMNTMIERGIRHDEAAYQALVIMNYGRKGGSQVLRHFLPLMPFLNARIQGLARLTEGAVGKRGAAGRKQAMWQLALNGSIYTLAGAAIWGANWFDEEKRERYEAEPLWRRLNYHVSYWGDTAIYLPKAFEIGHVFTSLPELFLDSMMSDLDQVPQGVKKMLADTVGVNLIPAAALPMVEIFTNHDFFRDAPVEGLRESSLRAADRVSGASPLARFVGQRLGISDLTKISPSVIEHFFQGYGGIYYVAASAITDMVGAELGLTPAQPGGAFGDMPVVSNSLNKAFGSFLKDTDLQGTRFIEEFYETKDHITQIYRSATEAARNGDIEYAREVLERANATPTAYKLVNKAGSKLSEVNARLRIIRNSTDMTRAEKRAEMKQLIQARNRLTKEIVKVIRQLEEQQGATFKAAS